MVNRPVGINEPPTHVVDGLRGPYRTLAEAVTTANAGDRILLRPGVYEEGLVLDKPLEVIGQGRPEEILIQAAGTNALAFRTTLGRVTNVTLRQLGGGDYFAATLVKGASPRRMSKAAASPALRIHGGRRDPSSATTASIDAGKAVWSSSTMVGALSRRTRCTAMKDTASSSETAETVVRGNQIHDNEHGRYSG
jgi:hypothetical protein